ncbi:hypothetical protein [Comamonas sp.]|uniref:hypothetical protein n=1 Tax=Comamonas sp. TaxID=34028 RepID=UPI00289775AF|nr:hypothetical protein [Comamonas sp.]
MSEAQKPNKGLLSKVVRFVTKPTTQWSELDKTPEPENPEAQFSKQALKEIMERKRRNDFVRKLEFDQLRKIRREANKSSSAGADGLGAASSAAMLEGGAAPDGAAIAAGKPAHPSHTIEKINQIERQMSKQWWSGDSASAPAVAPSATTDTAPASAPVPVAPAAAPLAAEPAEAAAVPAVAPAQATLPPAAFDAQVESARFIHDTDLEEAAVLFANGDAAGAEASLLALVQQRRGDLMGQLTIWLTLFDLYRATGDQTKFDFHAIEFASKYGRSAPVWFSMPQELGAKALQGGDAPAEEVRLLNWQAPPVLSVAALNGLLGNLKRFAPPWTLNWSRVTEVRDEAVVPLLAQFRAWADKPDVRLVFAGADQLLSVLEAQTPVGDNQVRQDLWSLRMALLRLLRLEQDFEAAALDYCITYEVSPPSWVPPRAEMSSDSTRSGAPFAPDLSMVLDLPERKPAVADSPQAVLEGVVEGDVSRQLDTFSPMVQPDMPFTVRCDRLMRIDFVAAGSVLNWVAECQQKNVLVRFGNLHRLNAVFFNLIGINEHSIVNQREN